MSRIISGVEEAGRGPVIGPMVMAICTIKEEDESKLTMLGVKDSKMLSPKERERLYKEIIKVVEAYKIKIIPAKQIDAALNDRTLNLNLLEANISAELINALKPDKTILDCPSTNIPAYRNYVKDKVTSKTEIIAEHKADVNHPIVSAASILAKVTRDKKIQELKSLLLAAGL